MANDVEQKGIWADLLRAASNIFRTPEDQEDPMKGLRGMIETGELGGAELGGAVLPGAGFIGTIGRVGAGTKTPMARFLKRVLERSMKGFQGPAAAKPVVGEVVKKIAPAHKQLPMPSYQEIWRQEYIKALKGAKATPKSSGAPKKLSVPNEKRWKDGFEPVGTIPGEPISYLDATKNLEGAKAAILEEAGGYVARRPGGGLIRPPGKHTGIFKTVDEAQVNAEKMLERETEIFDFFSKNLGKN